MVGVKKKSSLSGEKYGTGMFFTCFSMDGLQLFSDDLA